VDNTINQPITEKPGTVIGPYKLLQQIGEGGMGVVYMAEQTEPVERRVALKIIKPGMDTRPVIARFEAERQALAMMDHPNIAKVHDAGTTDTGRPYFVMELVNGIPITQFCDEQRLDVRHRLELFADVCHAVQHAHQKGIIHRDIKPSNILVALYDGHPAAKVIDFGVAKATSQKLTEKTMFTQWGQIVGTLEYMSPEQAQRNQLDIDTRSDIYSLGVLLYELLTGETPFGGQRLRSAAFDEMMRVIREEEPPRPSLRLSSSDSLASVAANRQIEPKKLSTLVHGELDWIVMKALEKDRPRRYETANGLAADVQHYLTDEPVEACPPSAVYRLKKFVRRNRAAITTASFIGVALLAGTAISTWQAIRATRAEDLASQRLVAEQQAHDEAKREQNRAESNLGLALKALDEVFLGAIVEDRLLAQPVSAAGDDSASGYQPDPLSDVEREWVNRGLEFYDQFARQNDSVSTAALDAARAYHRIGLFQASLGSLASAEKAYRAAIQRFERLANEQPDNSDFFSALGNAYRGLASVLPEWSAAKEVLETAFQAYSRAIEVSPNDHSLYLSRAQIARLLSDSQQAAEDSEKAVQLAPDNVEVLLACSPIPSGGESAAIRRASRRRGTTQPRLSPSVGTFTRFVTQRPRFEALRSFDST
jgi:serine/threonine protein kinase